MRTGSGALRERPSNWWCPGRPKGSFHFSFPERQEELRERRVHGYTETGRPGDGETGPWPVLFDRWRPGGYDGQWVSMVSGKTPYARQNRCPLVWIEIVGLCERAFAFSHGPSMFPKGDVWIYLCLMVSSLGLSKSSHSFHGIAWRRIPFLRGVQGKATGPHGVETKTQVIGEGTSQRRIHSIS